MHQALERLAQPLVARPTGESLERRVERRDGAVGSQREDHIAHPFDERAVLLFAVAPDVLGEEDAQRGRHHCGGSFSNTQYSPSSDTARENASKSTGFTM